MSRDSWVLDRLGARVVAGDGGVRALGGLTIVVLLFSADVSRYARLALAAVGLVGLLWPRVRDEVWFWPAVMVTLVIGYLPGWAVIDNHQYLFAWWCLALSAAVLSSVPSEDLALSGRLMIGLTFCFATVWRLMTPEFLDGTVMRFLIVADARLGGLAQIAGWLEPAQIEANRSVAALVSMDPTQVGIFEGGITAGTALGFTWALLLAEAAIAIAFLLPLRGMLETLRHGLLGLFLLLVHTVVPVIGFGWILAIMGLSQCARRPRTAAMYILLCAYLASVGAWLNRENALQYLGLG